MIAFLSGTIEYLGTDTVVIDVGGVGYEVKVSAEVSGALSAVGVGNTVKLYTYTYLREDQIALCGFRSRDDLALFKQLITVSGIGPRGGLSLLSVMTADDLRFAIVSGDARMISRAPGIGKKTAERLILDLRDKISSAYAVSDDPEIAAGGIDRAGAGGRDAVSEESSPASDAVEALVALGYMRAEAARAVKKCAKQNDTGAILQEALRYL